MFKYKYPLNKVIYMSLFKIYKGKAENLSLQPLVEGHAYFTPDDGGFYIDATKDETVSRIKINDIDEKINAVMSQIKVQDEELQFPETS